jgi:trehalose/maltose hydrolase-like predicted phosphorylase
LKRDITLTLTHKEAKKLLEAFSKGTFDKLTKAQANALAEFHTELLIEVQSNEPADWYDEKSHLYDSFP